MEKTQVTTQVLRTYSTKPEEKTDFKTRDDKRKKGNGDGEKIK